MSYYNNLSYYFHAMVHSLCLVPIQKYFCSFNFSADVKFTLHERSSSGLLNRENIRNAYHKDLMNIKEILKKG